MTTLLAIHTELGDDIDLLVFPDEWLKNHQLDLAAKVSRLLAQLDSVAKARQIKHQLQQQNRVAVLIPSRDSTGNIDDINIHIMPLSDAQAAVSGLTSDDTDKVARTAQLRTWERDRRDLAIAAPLHPQR